MSSSFIFGNKNFLLLWSGNVVSHIGLQGVRIAYPLLVLAITGSPISASLVAFALSLPGLIFEIPAGVAADYWDRRRILMTCQRVGLAATLLAAAVIVVQPPGLSLFLAVAAFAEGSAYVFFNTSELVLVRDVLAEEELPAAFSFLEAEQPIANMAGRTLGAITLGIARGLPFLANAMSYIYCLWTLAKIPARAAVERRADTANPGPARIWDWGHVWAGMRSVRSEPFVYGSTVILGCTNVILQVFILLITVEVKDSGHPTWTIGMVLGATGLGGLFAAAPSAGLAGRINPRTALTLMLWVWVVLCTIMVITSNPVLLAVCWMGVGFMAPIGNVPLTLYRVRAFPGDLVGRVFGASKLIAHGGTALGALMAGPLLSTLGIATTGWLLVAALVLLARRARRLHDPGLFAAAPPAVPGNWIARASYRGPDPSR
ncbi:MFS transporter [Nocardia sp. NPDC006630]|uniref:MFS transporter n=1 Tax=Nocardia sp. NPDC006630 TaxID=3157181 RepID=UPI00339FE4DC